MVSGAGDDDFDRSDADYSDPMETAVAALTAALREAEAHVLHFEDDAEVPCGPENELTWSLYYKHDVNSGSGRGLYAKHAEGRCYRLSTTTSDEVTPAVRAACAAVFPTLYVLLCKREDARLHTVTDATRVLNNVLREIRASGDVSKYVRT